MNSFLKKVFDAKDDYYDHFSGVANVLFMHPNFASHVLSLSELTLGMFNPLEGKLLGCEFVLVLQEDFEVMASSHDQMKVILERHIGTTDDIKLMKLPSLWETKMDYSKPMAVPLNPEYINMPYKFLKRYKERFDLEPKYMGRRIRM